VLIPDAFSPNNDGLNDDFFIYTKNGIRIVEFQVFNKWGEKMHDNSTQGWDGTHRNSLMQNGAYVYVVKLEHPDGSEEMLNGQFLLIR
jgi:gliding motility-associated-like protein